MVPDKLGVLGEREVEHYPLEVFDSSGLSGPVIGSFLAAVQAAASANLLLPLPNLAQVDLPVLFAVGVPSSTIHKKDIIILLISLLSYVTYHIIR